MRTAFLSTVHFKRLNKHKKSVAEAQLYVLNPVLVLKLIDLCFLFKLSRNSAELAVRVITLLTSD